MDRKTEFRKKDERTETEGDERAKDRDECERKQEEALIFARRSSLARTPPSTPTVPTVEEQIAPEAEMDDPWQDEKMDGSPIYQLTQEEDLAQSAKKRKRGLISPPKQKESRQETNRGDMMEVNSSLAKVVKRTRELKKLVNESTKTKVEIKHLARELAYLVDHLEKHVIQYQERHDCTVQRLPTETREVGIQTAAIGKSVAVQAETSDIEHEKLRAEEKMRTDIREALGSEGGFDGLGSILDKKWPEDMYTRTREASTSHGELNLEGDLALVLDPARATEDKAMENIMKMHPDLRAVVEKCDGQLDYMVKTIATRTRNLETTERTIAIYILPLKIDADGINDMEEAYDMVRRLRMSMDIHPTAKINMVLGENLNSDYIRKICECIFYGTDINITLVTNKEKPKSTTKPRGRPTTGKVVVKCGSTTYADLLRSVKEKVDPKRVGVNVRAIKKTARGDLMLEVDGDAQKADILRRAITRNIDNEVRIANRLVTIHVLDIDATTTKDQVEEAIKNMPTCSNLQDVVVKSMRPSRDGNQIATVQVSRNNANILLMAKRIKIGWVNCRVRERVAVTRCYKCLDFGHTLKECKGPDRSNLCINCHQPGHKARECDGPHFCPSCNTNEHRPDSTNCPKFRELIKAQRKIARKANTPLGGSMQQHNDQNSTN